MGTSGLNTSGLNTSGLSAGAVIGYFAGKNTKKSVAEQVIDSTDKLNDKIIAANDRASWLEAGMTLALTAKENEHEIKVLLIVFAFFVVYMIF